MDKRIALFFAAVLLLAVPAWAAPDSPTDLAASFDPRGILITWQHPIVDEVSFKVYRGSSVSDAKVIGTVEEPFFLDTTAAQGEEYLYFITAFDESGESVAVKFTVTIPVQEEKPFSIRVVSPEKTTFRFGEDVELVVAVESERFADLEDLRAVIVNDDFGLREVFAYDAEMHLFSVSFKVPESERPEHAEGFSTKYDILVTAYVAGEQYSEPASFIVSLVPETVYQYGDPEDLVAWFFLNYWPVILILFLASAAVAGWRFWAWQIISVRDRKRLRILEISKQRALWRHDFFKRKVSADQFREKESELQAKQLALEEKLGIVRPKGKERPNPFMGFTPAEIEEVMRLVKTIRKPKEGDTEEGLRARLAGFGRKEKVAKKVAALVFERYSKP